MAENQTLTLPLSQPEPSPDEIISVNGSEGSFVIDMSTFSPAELLGVAAFLRECSRIQDQLEDESYWGPTVTVRRNGDRDFWLSDRELLRQRGICQECRGTGTDPQGGDERCWNCEGDGANHELHS